VGKRVLTNKLHVGERTYSRLARQKYCIFYGRWKDLAVCMQVSHRTLSWARLIPLIHSFSYSCSCDLQLAPHGPWDI